MARSLLSEILMIFLGFSVKQISEGAGILSSDSVELLLLYFFLLFFVFELPLHHFCTNNKISILPNNTKKKISQSNNVLSQQYP